MIVIVKPIIIAAMAATIAIPTQRRRTVKTVRHLRTRVAPPQIACLLYQQPRVWRYRRRPGKDGHPQYPGRPTAAG